MEKFSAKEMLSAFSNEFHFINYDISSGYED